MIKRIVEGGAFSSPVDLTEKDEIQLGSNRVVKIHSVCVPENVHVTRWAMIQIGDHYGYVFGGETLHRDLEKAHFLKASEIYVSKRRKT